MQNSESYGQIGREDQNPPKTAIFLFAPSVLQSAVKRQKGMLGPPGILSSSPGLEYFGTGPKLITSTNWMMYRVLANLPCMRRNVLYRLCYASAVRVLAIPGHQEKLPWLLGAQDIPVVVHGYTRTCKKYPAPTAASRATGNESCNMGVEEETHKNRAVALAVLLALVNHAVKASGHTRAPRTIETGTERSTQGRQQQRDSREKQGIDRVCSGMKHRKGSEDHKAEGEEDEMRKDNEARAKTFYIWITGAVLGAVGYHSSFRVP
ncbi:hypothetical protein B0H19DRAFT_1073898 [Mycena capillaripes]|nr:hypothetical protein B0H19DRAFT_1073898 [Mycena capillaripes]